MSKILFLPAYFQPEHAASPYIERNIYEALMEKYGLVFYCPTPTRGIDLETRKKYCSLKKECLYGGKMRVHRFSLFREGKNPCLRAFRYVLGAVIQLCKGLMAKDARKCNIIFLDSTPPIQGVVAAFIKKIRGIPFVYNLQDIFPDSLVGTGLAKKEGFFWKIGRIIENFTYRNADKIIVISQDFKKNIMAKGVPEEKIVVIYNWVEENNVIDIPRAKNVLFDRYNLDPSKFYVTYCGNIGLTQNMDLLLEVAKELEQEYEIQFVLIGEGAYKKNVEEIIEAQGIKNVKVLPFQPYEEISYVFSLGNVGLIISKPGVGENSVPSKTWSIMSASRPVLANFDENELKSIIEDHQCGIFTKAGDKEALKQSILKLYRNQQEGISMGLNGRKFIMDNLTKDVGANKYVDVINLVLSRKKNV